VFLNIKLNFKNFASGITYTNIFMQLLFDFNLCRVEKKIKIYICRLWKASWCARNSICGVFLLCAVLNPLYVMQTLL